MSRRKMTISLALLMASAAIPAFAQEAGPPAPTAPPAAAPEDFALPEVVVTARKRTENILTIPVADALVTGQQLVRENITTLPDLTYRVPNYRVTLATSSPFTFIRGFGSGSSLSFEQSVGKFVDNVSYGRDQDARIPIFDVERVEILKGPQVLVFGNSTTAGAISIVTKKPGKEYSGDASLSYEFNNQEYIAQGGVSIPLGERAALRVAGMSQELADGWIENPLAGRSEPQVDNRAGRVTLSLEPVDGWDVNLKAELSRARTDGATLQPITQTTIAAGAFSEINRDLSRSVNNNVAPFFQNEFAEIRNQTYQADVTHDFGGVTATSTTAFRRMAYTSSLTNNGDKPIFNAVIDQDYDQFSQELRLQGKVGQLDYVVGGYYERGDLESFTFLELNLGLLGLPPSRGGVPLGNLYLYDHVTKTRSTFADLTYHLTDTLRIGVGARYTDADKTALQTSDPTNIVPGLGFDPDRSTIIAAINPALTAAAIAGARSTPHRFDDLKLSESHLQPQVVVQYDFATGNMAYFKFVKGDKMGGFDANYSLAARQTPFLSEGAQAYELGAKGRLLDGRFEYSLAAFRQTFDDLQVSVFVSPNTLVSNVGKARSQGVELDFAWAPVEGLKISGNGAYLDAKFLDFPGAACTVAQALATPSGTTCAQDRSGTPTQFSSKWTGGVTVDYKKPVLGGDYEVAGGVSLYLRSKYNASTTNDPLFVQDGYAQIDAHLDLEPSDGRWTVSVFGKNLGDKHYLEYGTTTSILSGGAAVALSRGRQVGLRVAGRF